MSDFQLKNLYDRDFFDSFCQEFKKVVPEFDRITFQSKIFDNQWESRELKARMRHITLTLHDFLPKDFAAAATTLCDFVKIKLAKSEGGLDFLHMFLPDYIEIYGIDDYQHSMKALEIITQFTSAEFAIRPFIVRYPQTISQLSAWAQHPNPWVRRLASEGSRPRLPWAMALPAFKKNPAPTLSILEMLKNDDAETVRRSVANHLNDIAKDHPELVLELASRWKGQNPQTDWVVRHGCRTLLKKANPHILNLFGIIQQNEAHIEQLIIEKTKIRIGENLQFNFRLRNEQKARLRLEYAINYLKASGKSSQKIFQITENDFDKGVFEFVRKQSFRNMTTRQHYAGKHTLSILLNGTAVAELDFEVENEK